MFSINDNNLRKTERHGIIKAMQKKTIFISSVQKEFESERQSLKAKILSNPILNKFFDIFLFEDTPARDKNTMDICLNKIAECDIYIGLIGNQYGALDISGISVTEREFEEATKLKKERLIFVKGSNDSERDERELLFLKKISPQLIRRRFRTLPNYMMRCTTVLRNIYPVLERFQRFRLMQPHARMQQ